MNTSGCVRSTRLRRARLPGMLLATLLPLFSGCFRPPYPQGTLAQLFPQAPQPQMKSIRVDGLTLRYAELDRSGTPRIVFVHGSPGEWQGFAGYMKRPELQAYGPLLAPDRPGYGGSASHVVIDDLAEQARCLAPLLRGKGAPAIIVGHSYGGAIAARLAMDDPQLVRGLLLLAPAVAPQYEAPRWYRQVLTWRIAQWLLPQVILDSNRELLPLQAQLREMAPRWAKLRMPVYVMVGEDDRLVDPRTADFLERELAQTPHRIWRYPQAGHALPWTHSEHVVRALHDLIAATEPAGTVANQQR